MPKHELGVGNAHKTILREWKIVYHCVSSPKQIDKFWDTGKGANGSTDERQTDVYVDVQRTAADRPDKVRPSGRRAAGGDCGRRRSNLL